MRNKDIKCYATTTQLYGTIWLMLPPSAQSGKIQSMTSSQDIAYIESIGSIWYVGYIGYIRCTVHTQRSFEVNVSEKSIENNATSKMWTLIPRSFVLLRLV